MAHHPARMIKWLLAVFILAWTAGLNSSNTELKQTAWLPSPVPAQTAESGSSPQSPMRVEAYFSKAPQPGQAVDLVIELTTLVDAPDTTLSISLTEGLQAVEGQTSWQLDLAAGERRRLVLPLAVNTQGEGAIHIRAVSRTAGGSTFGARRSLYLQANGSEMQVSDLPAELLAGGTSSVSHSEPRPEESIPPRRERGDYPSDNPKLARLNNPDRPEAPQGTINVYGWYSYEDNDGGVHPVRYALVEIFDFNGGVAELLGETYTDADGYYDLGVPNDPADPRDIVVVINSDDRLSVQVRDKPGMLYRDISLLAIDVPDGNYYVGDVVISDPNNTPAWFIYDKISHDAYFYLGVEAGWFNHQHLRVYWEINELDDGSYYHPDVDEVHLLGEHGWEEDVILHEYGHFVMDQIYASFPPATNCDPHYWGVSSSDGCAWTEGWADFLQGAIQGHKDFLDDSQEIVIDMEAPDPAEAGDNDEAAVGASLWDIFDGGSNETHDQLSSGLNGSDDNGLWQIIYDENPNTVYEFWDAWFGSANGGNCALRKILFNHSITVFNPCSPFYLDASDGDHTDRVALDWFDVPNATYYQVFRSTTSGGSKTYLGTSTSSDFDDSSATTPEWVYTYTFKACNNVNCGEFSVEEKGHRALVGPGSVSASDGAYSDKVRISWNGVSGAIAYRVYVSDTAGGAKYYLGQTGSLLFDSNPVTPEKPYYYWVKACNSYDCGEYSATDSGYREMPTPANLAASDGTYTSKIRLDWSHVPGASVYNIYRGSDPGSLSYLAVSPNAFYDDTNAIPGRLYFYSVQAVNVYGSGAQSQSNQGWREMAVPSGFSASDGSFSDKVRISWNSVYGAERYEVSRSDSPGSSTILLGSPSASPLDDSGATPEKHYYYNIRACNSYRCSNKSAEDEGWRELAGPSGLSASDGAYSDKVRLTWNSLAGASLYKVYGGETSAGAVFLGETSSTTFDHSSGTPKMIYFYHVEACNSYGCGKYSNDDSGWRELATPGDVSAGNYADDGFVRVTWTEVGEASFYKIWRGSNASSLSVLGDAAGTPFDDAGALPYTTYWYAVQACNFYGCGPVSSADDGITAVGAAQNVIASDGTYSDKIRITWSSVTGAIRYDIYKKVGSSYYRVGDSTGTSFDYVQAPSMKVLEFRVEACNTSGHCGDPSAPDSGWRMLATPTNLQASDGTAFGRVHISWDFSWDGLIQAWVNAYRAESAGGPWVEIPSGGWDTIDDTGAQPEVNYLYRARACNEYGCGEYSNLDGGWRKDHTSAATASDGTSSEFVQIDWNSVEGAEFYRVHASQWPETAGSWVPVSGPVYGTSFQYGISWLGRIYYFAVQACVVDTQNGNNICAERGPYDSGWRAVPAPANVKASDGSNPLGVQITWDLLSSPSYVGYKIFRAEGPDAPKEFLGRRDCPISGCEASWIDTAPSPGVETYYFVQACNGPDGDAVCGEYSSTDSGYSPYPVYLPLINQGGSSAAAPVEPVSLLPLLSGMGLLALWRRWRP